MMGACLTLLVFLVACLPGAHAQPPSAQIGSKGSYVLSDSFAFYEDRSSTLTLEDVRRAELQAKFKPVTQGPTSTNFDATDSAIWLRIPLETTEATPVHWLLDVASPPLDEVDVYLLRPDGNLSHY